MYRAFIGITTLGNASAMFAVVRPIVSNEQLQNTIQHYAALFSIKDGGLYC